MKKLFAPIILALALLPTSSAVAAPQWVTCDPVNVTTYGSRIHVQCSASISGISFFARSAADDAEVARFMSTLLVAQVAGRTLSIMADFADTSGTAIGCGTSDCRLIQAVGFGN